MPRIYKLFCHAPGCCSWLLAPLIRLLAGALCAVLSATTFASAESLFVFYPTPVRPQALQQRISESCPELAVTVFGRYKDFSAQVESGAPNAVLVVGPVAGTLPGYRKQLSGKLDGRDCEALLLLSVGSSIDPDGADTLTIGAVELMGKSHMDELMLGRFKVAPRLKRVTKVEDLLPLLTFNMADAILVMQSQSGFFATASNLKLVTTPLRGGPFTKVSLLVHKKRESSIAPQCFQKWPEDLNALLGVDSWH